MDERVELIDKLDFAYNDAIYDVVYDFVVKGHLKEMDDTFHVEHSRYERYGGDFNGADITKIGVQIPRTDGNRLVRFFSPHVAVISIGIRDGTIRYNAAYQKVAEKMKQEYDELLYDRFRNRLGREFNLELEQA